MEDAREGEHRGFGDLPAESFFVDTQVVYGVRTYNVRQQHWMPMVPSYPPSPPSPGLDPAAPHPDPDGSEEEEEEEEGTSGEGEGGFQGPVNILEFGAAFLARARQQQQQQRKRGRVTASSEAAILRLLPEVTPTDCCSDDCCAICLEDFADASAAAAAAADPLTLRAMPSCSHVFHKQCILKWLRRNAVCPVCRRQLPPVSTEEEDDDDDEEEERARRRSSIRRSVNEWVELVAHHTRERQRQD